jgi:phosphoglycolate phosphatase-like HAD superfamily hydrolase
MQKLILFDVDQTLVDALAHHEAAYEIMFKEIFSTNVKLSDISFAGKTVPNIIREMAKLKGIPDDVVEQKLNEAIKRLEEIFRESVDKGKLRVLPGVKELLRELKRRGHLLGILTGNPEGMTQSMLEKGGLRDYFDLFVYGPEGKDRVELVKIAMDEARRKFGCEFSGKNIVVVGDSIHDIDSGKPHGALTIAVATGFYSRKELLKHKPDYLFEDLTDTKILEVLQ